MNEKRGDSMGKLLNSQIIEKKQSDDNTEQPDFNPEAFPSRKETHKRRSRAKTRGNERKRKKRIQFPLVRIWLFLFLLLVALVTTYPLWR